MQAPCTFSSHSDAISEAPDELPLPTVTILMGMALTSRLSGMAPLHTQRRHALVLPPPVAALLPPEGIRPCREAHRCRAFAAGGGAELRIIVEIESSQSKVHLCAIQRRRTSQLKP
jgi:hypothetical protein